MSNVAIFQPYNETVELCDWAELKSLQLLADLLKATTELMKAERDFDQAHDKVIQLRNKYAKARNRLSCLAEAMETVHERRAEVWSAMQNGLPAKIIATNDDGTSAVILYAARKFAKVVCSDIEVLERGTDGSLNAIALPRKRA